MLNRKINSEKVIKELAIKIADLEVQLAVARTLNTSLEEELVESLRRRDKNDGGNS